MFILNLSTFLFNASTIMIFITNIIAINMGKIKKLVVEASRPNMGGIKVIPI